MLEIRLCRSFCPSFFLIERARSVSRPQKEPAPARRPPSVGWFPSSGFALPARARGSLYPLSGSGHCRIMNSRHKTEATKRELDDDATDGEKRGARDRHAGIPNNWRHLCRAQRWERTLAGRRPCQAFEARGGSRRQEGEEDSSDHLPACRAARRDGDPIPQMTDLPLFVVQRCRQPLRRVSFGLRGRPDSLAVIDLRSPISGNFSIFSHLGGRRIPHFQRKRFPRNSVGIATLSTSRPHGHWLGNDGAAERELCGGRGR